MATWVYESVTASVAESGGGAVEVKTAESVVTPSGATDTILSISATPFNGYKFDRWVRVKTYTYKDGIPDYTLEDVFYSDTRYEQVDWWDSSEESTTLVSQTTHYTAFFIPEEQPPTPPVGTSTVSVVASPSNAGAVTGGGTFNNGSSCTITATPNSGYDFINWTNDQSPTTITTPTHTFTVDGDVTWTAHFERKHVWVWVKMDPDDMEIGDVELVPNTPAPRDLRRYYYGDTVRSVARCTNDLWCINGWSPALPNYTVDSYDYRLVDGRTCYSEIGISYVFADSEVEQHKEYSDALQDYVLYLTYKFRGIYDNGLIILSIVEGTSLARLQTPVVRSIYASRVTVLDSTAFKYRASVPLGVSAFESIAALPAVTGAYGAYTCKITITPRGGGTATTNTVTVTDLEQAMSQVNRLANYFVCDIQHLYIEVEYYIARQKTYLPLCTGTDATDGGEAGRILCNASGQLLYDG